MNITDLTEVNADFEIKFDGDGVDYWDYTFYAKVNGEHEYMQSLHHADVITLRENCKRILEATNDFEF